MLDTSKIILVTDEENERIRRGIEADPEAYVPTEEEWSEFRPAAEVMPEFVEHWRKVRGKQKTPTKIKTTVRFSPEVLEYFKNTGDGWQTHMDEVLREYVGSKAA